MRRWGLVVSLFYAALVFALLIPGVILLAGEDWRKAYSIYVDDGWGWVWWGVVLIAGEVLMFLPVDRTWRKLRPRTHVAVTAAGMGAAVALLTFGFITIPFAAIYGDKDWPGRMGNLVEHVFISLLILWSMWGVVFYAYYRRRPARMARALNWLIRGSILELLIAVPAHVIVRRRNDCSAPIVTGFGIITGTAIMLMCLGPGVVALYKRRMQRYRPTPPAVAARHA
ncbi:MAG TPA: hypothetical protein VFJ02_25575 [Vicinamibacterales bacterium]|nr:hypothetical protein [Vicinamibacterales bacterium]